MTLEPVHTIIQMRAALLTSSQPVKFYTFAIQACYHSPLPNTNEGGNKGDSSSAVTWLPLDKGRLLLPDVLLRITSWVLSSIRLPELACPPRPARACFASLLTLGKRSAWCRMWSLCLVAPATAPGDGNIDSHLCYLPPYPILQKGTLRPREQSERGGSGMEQGCTLH